MRIVVTKLCTLTIGAIVLCYFPAIALGQDTLEVPPPTQQNQPNFTQPPPPRPSPPIFILPGGNNDEPIQLLPPELFMPQRQAPPPRPRQQVQTEPSPRLNAPLTTQGPALPEVFSGCWQGLVSNVDWIRKEPGAHKVGYWTAKTYRLCYKRVGKAPFKMTFTETGIAPNDQIFNVHGGVAPLTTDGRAFATMRASLHFEEYSVGRNATAPTFAVDEVTHLDCKI